MIRATITATKFKNHVGQYIEESNRGPVAITKHGRITSVLVDVELYKKMLHVANEARRVKMANTPQPPPNINR